MQVRGDRDRGAVLILALLFVVAVGLVATALATWATNDLNNSKTFNTVEALHSDATGMMKLSVQYVRYNPIISTSQASNVASPVTACWGGSNPALLPVIDVVNSVNIQVAVWCSTVWSPGTANTRTVTFYACPVAEPASVCTTTGKTLLTEVVIFDDYPAGVNAPIQALCTVTCGSGETVKSSNWGSSIVDAQAITPTTITFTQEPSPTSVGSTTTAYVQILGASALPISNEPVTLTASSGGTLTSASTLVYTNATGIAVFNNIVPSSAGSIILTAADVNGSLTTTSTAFQVGKGANTINLSAVPINPYMGTSLTVSATATSLDPIVISGTPGIIVSSTTTTVCTASGGTITLVGVGPCTLSFSDSGNANYFSVTAPMTFSVVAVPPANVVVTAAPSSVGASAVTNDQLTLTLQSAGGTNTVSTGTTIVTLTHSGSGYFANANGAASNTTTASFGNGVGIVTVYFGDTVAEGGTITASSGSLTSGTTSVTVTAGAAKVVGVTASTPVVANSVTNDAVNLVLQDQFGNTVSPTIQTTLNLSSSGSGYTFAAASGSATPIATVILPAGGSGKSTVYFGDTHSGTATLTVTGSGGLTGSTFVAVSAASPSQVVLSLANTTRVSSSSNLAVNISLKDQYGNPVTPSVNTSFNLASTGSGYFTSSNGGISPHISSATILANASSVTVYFGDATVQSPTITVSRAGLVSATATITVTP
jgi:hypothetical protein